MPSAPTFRLFSVLVCVLAAACGFGRADAQVPKLFANGPLDRAPTKASELVKADLLADTTAIVPGKTFTVGLRLQMAPEWHTYWKYSGDAGLPTKIAWQLPEGFQAGPIQWPLPEKIVSPGDIINYGYSNETMLIVDITPPAKLPPGDVTLKAKAEWLVCRESCIPGSKELALTLPGDGSTQPANTAIFEKYRALLPLPLSATKFLHDPPTATLDGKTLTLTFNDQADRRGSRGEEFFPLPEDPVEIDHPEAIKTTVSGEHRILVEKIPLTSDPKDGAAVGGVLISTAADGTRSGLAVPPIKPVIMAAAADGKSATSAAGTTANVSRALVPSGTATPAGSLGYFLLIGFLGGLILNVMPCVLPVISLKLFSFVKQANQSRERIFKLGLAYAAGVFAWFLGFAALVIALKSAGHQVGYAFHLQTPWFLVGLSAVTFVFALNLLGVFEIILPGSVTGAAGEVAGSREGYTGAFLQGMLATVLGSACTAPFFGPALGFAFSQSGPVILAMFAAIAAGMSAPFVLLAAQPGWMKFLPKPGAWMEHVKQATGFLLLATVLWLLFSVGHGLGADGVVWTGVLMLALGVACWVQGTFNTLVASDRVRWASRVAIALLVCGGGWACAQRIGHSAPPVASVQPFGVQLAAALKTGRTVFVDLTAEWCVSCKANEKAVLASESIQKALRDQNVVFLTGDFTTYSDDIAKVLKQYNAPSVPLYLVYPAGKPDAPIVLPPLLTKQTVLDALAAAQMAADKPVAAR